MSFRLFHHFRPPSGRRALCGALCAALLLGGCSYNQTGIDSMLKPPKLSDEQNKLYAALEQSVGNSAKSGIRLVYPRKGDFTSAFVKNNLDSESTQETLVFYEVHNSATATMPIRINVLDQQNGEWVSVSDVATVAGASEVEKLYFVNIQQQVYIVVGFNLSNSTDKSLVVYSFEEGMLKEKYSTKCTNFEVIDLNDDKESEIVTITTQKSETDPSGKTVSAELRRLTGHGNAIVLSAAVLDPAVTEYKNIIRGKLGDGRPALYLDGLRGANYYSTEILACYGNEMDNLMYQGADAENLIEQTIRIGGVLPLDLNNDGVVEIPVRVPAPGYEDSEKHQQEYLTQWYIYESGKGKGRLSLSRTTYVAGTLGYIFTLPESWLPSVSVEYVSTDRELFVYEVDGSGGRGSTLLSIKVVDNAGFQKDAADKGYSMLRDHGQILYTYKLGPAAAAFGVTAETVAENFMLHKLQ